MSDRNENKTHFVSKIFFILFFVNFSTLLKDTNNTKTTSPTIHEFEQMRLCFVLGIKISGISCSKYSNYIQYSTGRKNWVIKRKDIMIRRIILVITSFLFQKQLIFYKSLSHQKIL